MILKRVTFSNREKENKDKKMSLKKKIALIGGISAGLMGLTAASIFYHNNRKANQLKKKMKNSMKDVNDSLKDSNNKQRKMEERAKNEVNKELEKLNKKTVDEYLPKKDQIKNTKELDDFMLK